VANKINSTPAATVRGVIRQQLVDELLTGQDEAEIAALVADLDTDAFPTRIEWFIFTINLVVRANEDQHLRETHAPGLVNRPGFRRGSVV